MLADTHDEAVMEANAVSELPCRRVSAITLAASCDGSQAICYANKVDVPVIAIDRLLFEWADLFHPRLTAMAQPALSMGEQAVSLALSRIASPSLAPRKVAINPAFMHRESCGCPPPEAL
ncbi:substrate-binding domain-containing protein [Streptomyces chartreusis]|uniref:substrate-binding domain-containing protein n=1 Tax=Streptomyces chartreusis TaxID=1969 RepID=UPI002E18A9C9